MKRLLSLFAVMLTATPVIAQDEPLLEEEQEEIRRYTVEIIIFSYAQDVATGTEVFVPDVIEVEEPLLEEGLVFEDIMPAEELTQEVEEPLLRELELVVLDEEAYEMQAAMGRLERLDAYQPLMHFAWTQATWPEEETPSTGLRAFAEPPAGLDGSLTLYLGRYLHLVVSLTLDAEPAQELTTDYLDPTVGPVRYRIDENRIIKNGETRYFDHPKFGVIARVTRVEEESAEEDDAGLTGSSGQ
jgi:hypothetical protein